MRVKLYTATVYHRPSGSLQTRRWSTIGYQSWPSDMPTVTTWLPLVRRPADLVVRIPVPGDGGKTQAAEGRLVLSNVFDRQAGIKARPLNELITDCVTEGWPILVQEVEHNAPLSTAVTVFVGVMGRAEIARGEITVPVKDCSADFDAPLLKEKYGGGGGLDGPAELKDKTKERCFGPVAYLEPTYLYYDAATGLHRLSVNGGHPVDAIEAFGDSGAARPYVSGTPSGSQWTYDSATGIILCSGTSRPTAPWARVRGDKTDGVYRHTVGALMAWIVTGLTAKRLGAMVDWDSVTALDSIPRDAGIFIPPGSDITIRDILDQFAGSIWGGFWTEGALGRFRVGRVPAATGGTVASYRAGVSCDPITPSATSTTPTAKQVNYRYARNYAVIDTPTGAATTDEAARAKAEYLDAKTTENTAVTTAYGSAATDQTFETLLYSRTDALAEAALAAADLESPARTYDVTTWDGAAGIDLTAIVTAYDDIPGFESGGHGVVIARNLHRRGGKATLTILV